MSGNECWCEHVDIGVGMQKVDHNPMCPVCNEPCAECGRPSCDGQHAGDPDVDHTCGYNPIDAVPNCDWDRSCPEHEEASGSAEPLPARCAVCHRLFGHASNCIADPDGPLMRAPVVFSACGSAEPCPLSGSRNCDGQHPAERCFGCGEWGGTHLGGECVR